MSQRNVIINYVLENFNTTPEYLFKSDPTCCVFRHHHSKKWFGIIMNIKGNKVGLETWLTILLDGSVTEEQIYNLLDISCELTRKTCKSIGNQIKWKA